MSIDKRKVSDIIVGERIRQDLGDIAALAKSIRELGLLQPVVITVDNKLVAGRRRLAAVEELGWTDVPVHVAHTVDDAVKLLKAERDENECRKDFTPSEAVKYGEKLEELERAEAKKRQQASRAQKGQKVGAAQGGGNLPPRSPGKGKTRDKVAEAVGMSGRTYEKAKTVVEAAEKDPEALSPVKEEMDRTGKVEPAFQEVKRRQEAKPQKTREQRQAERQAEEQEAERRRYEAEHPDLERHLNDRTGELTKDKEELQSLVAEIGVDAWEKWKSGQQGLLLRLSAAWQAFADLLQAAARTPAEDGTPAPARSAWRSRLQMIIFDIGRAAANLRQLQNIKVAERRPADLVKVADRLEQLARECRKVAQAEAQPAEAAS